MFSGTRMRLRSADPCRPPRGGVMLKLAAPNVIVMAISGCAITNDMMPNVSGSWPGHWPAAGANAWKR